MDLKQIYKIFPIELPLSKDGVFWNGKPDEFSNIGFNPSYSQKFGMTQYALNTGVYGKYNGINRGHNGHDFSGADRTPLVLPCRAWVSFIGWDEKGYGNYCFFETETKTINGESVKMEYVLAHMVERPIISLNKWHEAGTVVGYMGNTGMSSGTHTHFAGRPLIRKTDGSWNKMFDDQYRGYIDLEQCFIKKPIYNKQLIINANNMLEKYEKKLIIEGDGAGRKFVVVGGKLRQIQGDREAHASLYILANNGLGVTVSGEMIDTMEKDKDF